MTEEVKLFLIEDDDIDAMTVTREFKKQRISNPIVRARDGLEALEMLRTGKIERPYIILLDLRMPRMNGLEFLEAIRSDDDLKDSVVFVLTTSKDDRDITESYKKQIAGYFVKDQTGSEFLNVVNLLEGYWKVVHFPSNG
ncbi:response regulator [Aliikangiella sp. IMCC44653]